VANYVEIEVTANFFSFYIEFPTAQIFACVLLKTSILLSVHLFDI